MNLLHEFFNSSSDANKYLTAEQQEEVENDFEKWSLSPHTGDEEYMAIRSIIRSFVRWQLEKEMVDPLTVDYEVAEMYLDKKQ